MWGLRAWGFGNVGYCEFEGMGSSGVGCRM